MTATPTGFSIVPKWLFEQGLDATSIGVYAALAAYADSHGVCWPSISRLAEMLSISRNTVKRALRDLEDVGVVAWAGRQAANGAQTSHVYRIAVFTPHTTQPTTPEPSTPPRAPSPSETSEATDETLENEEDNEETACGQDEEYGDETTEEKTSALAVGRGVDHGQNLTTPLSNIDQPPVKFCLPPGQNLTTNNTNRTKPREQSPFIPPRGKNPRARPRSEIPTDWNPSPAHAALADDLGVSIWSASEAFKADAKARRRRLSDWDAGFTAWLHGAPRRTLPGACPTDRQVRADPEADRAAANIAKALAGSAAPTVLDAYASLDDDGALWPRYLAQWRKYAAQHGDPVRADRDATQAIKQTFERKPV